MAGALVPTSDEEVGRVTVVVKVCTGVTAGVSTAVDRLEDAPGAGSGAGPLLTDLDEAAGCGAGSGAAPEAWAEADPISENASTTAPLIVARIDTADGRVFRAPEPPGRVRH